MTERRSSFRLNNALLAVIAIMLGAIFWMLWRSDVKQERLIARQDDVMDYGKFVGRYESEQTRWHEEMADLREKLEVHDAWKTAIKANLGELLAYTEGEHSRVIIRRMIEEEGVPE